MEFSAEDNTINSVKGNTEEIETGIKKVLLEEKGNVSTILFNSDKSEVVFINNDENKVLFYNVTTSKVEKTITNINMPMDGVISPDNKYVFIICYDSYKFYRIPLNNSKEDIKEIKVSIKPKKMVMNRDDSKIYLTGTNNRIIEIDGENLKEIRNIPINIYSYPTNVADFKITSDNKTLILLSWYGGEIFAVNIETGNVNKVNIGSYAKYFYASKLEVSKDDREIFVLGKYKDKSYIIKFALDDGKISYIDGSILSKKISDINLCCDKYSIYGLSIIDRNFEILSTLDLSVINNIPLKDGPYYFAIDKKYAYGCGVNKESGRVVRIDSTIAKYISSEI